MSISFPRWGHVAGCLAVVACLLPSSALAVAGPPNQVANAPQSNKNVQSLPSVKVEGKALPYALERQALTPGNVSLVDAKALDERTVTNVDDALRYVPGVLAQSRGGGDAMFISIRGSNLDGVDYDNSGVLLLQDGLPVTAADGNNHNRFPDPMLTRRIIVARGANALSYGASTLGGAIDFISRTARNSNPRRMALQGGAHGLLDARVSTGGISGNLDGMVGVEKKRWNGYRSHSRERRTSVHANGGWRASDQLDVRLFASHVKTDEELPGALSRAQIARDRDQADPSALHGNYQHNVTSDRVAAKATWRVNEDQWFEFGLSWENQRLYHPIVDQVFVDFDGPGPRPPAEVFSLLIDTDQRTTGAMARWHLHAGSHHVVAGFDVAQTHVGGGNFRNLHGWKNGLTETVDNASRDVNMFMLDRWGFAPGWTLVYGAQGVYTTRDVRITSVDSGQQRHPHDDYSSFNPRIGLLYSLGDNVEAYASISHLYEAPTMYLLKSDVRGGDATLDAMHGIAYELGLRGSRPASPSAPSWQWNLAVYVAPIRNEILAVEDPNAPGTSLSSNIDRTRHEGIEANLHASFPVNDGGWRIEPRLSATINRFSFVDDRRYGNNRLPGAPDYAVHGELMFRSANGFFAGPTFALVGKRWADYHNSYRVAAHHLWGLRAGFKADRWELFAEARNLANTDYIGSMSVRAHASPGDAILYPGAPRSFYAGLKIHY